MRLLRVDDKTAASVKPHVRWRGRLRRGGCVLRRQLSYKRGIHRRRRLRLWQMRHHRHRLHPH